MSASEGESTHVHVICVQVESHDMYNIFINAGQNLYICTCSVELPAINVHKNIWPNMQL